MQGRGLVVASLVSLGLLAGCSDSSDRPNNPPQPAPLPFQELFDQGIDRYLGEYTPMLSEENADNSAIVDHTLVRATGRFALDGFEYIMSTLDAGSEDLLIFLEGGGACWSEFCSATPER